MVISTTKLLNGEELPSCLLPFSLQIPVKPLQGKAVQARLRCAAEKAGGSEDPYFVENRIVKNKGGGRLILLNVVRVSAERREGLEEEGDQVLCQPCRCH